MLVVLEMTGAVVVAVAPVVVAVPGVPPVVACDGVCVGARVVLARTGGCCIPAAVAMPPPAVSGHSKFKIPSFTMLSRK